LKVIDLEFFKSFRDFFRQVSHFFFHSSGGHGAMFRGIGFDLRPIQAKVAKVDHP
jgi:hypothetical protein